MKHGIVYRDTKSFFRYQGWPTVCVDESGVLYAAASGHRVGHICPFGKNLMYVSRDGGETWSAPRIINDTPLDDRDAGLTWLGNGKLMLSWFVREREFYWKMEDYLLETKGDHRLANATAPLMRGMLESWKELSEEDAKIGSFVRLSHDCGEIWDEAVKVPLTAPHGPIRLKNGKLVYLGRYFDGRDCTNENTIAACGSDDDGKTWQMLGDVPTPDGIGRQTFHEPHVVELPSGRLLGAIRAQGQGVDFGFTVYLCTSDDGGKTWTMPKPTGICGSPPHLMLHSSGAVILTYACRSRDVGYGQKCKLIYDGGETWSEEYLLAEAKDGDQGYPSTVELPDGSLITVYYQKFEDDRECSVLYTKWTLDELKN